MIKREVQDFFKDRKQDILVELLYAKNRSKGVSKHFVEMLVGLVQNEAIKLLNKARSFEEFGELIRNNYEKLCTSYGSMFVFYVTGSVYGLYEGGRDMIRGSVAKNVLESGVRPEDFKEILEEYSDVFIAYINKHKEIKHNLLRKKNLAGVKIADFTEEFDEKSFREICNLLFKSVDGEEWERKAEFSKLVCSLLAIYDRKVLLNNSDFVKFEIEYGYFDRYYETLVMGGKIPSLAERLAQFHLERNISSEQQYRLNNVDLLEKRIESLKYPSKVIFLDKIRQIREESDIKRKAELVDACFDYYEKEYRKEIVESVFSPDCSVEVGDYRTLQPAMLHLFLRDPMKKLNDYKDKVKGDILARRGVKVTGVEELTVEEAKEYQERIDYAIHVLLNPVITSKSLEGKSLYSDSSGFRWYQSDTSDQISIGLFRPDELVNLSNCVGVGFDRTSVDSSNIVISSSMYQTTNMGVSELEVLPEFRFKSFSAPLAELCNADRTEIVMYREKDGIKTEAAYVFAVVNGFDEVKDRETILRAKEYAEKNQVKLVVFNTKKLKQSYEAMFKEVAVASGMGVDEAKTL